MKNRITSKKITKLKENEIFVFGSNSKGNHAGGAAKTAVEKFGAIEGVSNGMQGSSYGIDTMSGIEKIKKEIDFFIEFAKQETRSVFLVTEIGCGIAGFKSDEIAPLFSLSKDIENIHLPESFWNILNLPKVIKGYKIFNSDFKCRDYRFCENSEHKYSGKIQICGSGFHFCLKLSDCFSYYDFNQNNIICEVEALGKVQYHNEDSKACTNHLKIGKRLTWQDVLFLANEGKDNTGHSNTGDSNTGDSNTGTRNTGDRNTGTRNTGTRNTGTRNTGTRNTGDSNTGDRNTGTRNTGDRNTGDWNTGDRNTGYSNTGDRNTGAFCTGEKTMKFFNKDSDWTEEKFQKSKAFELLCAVDTKLWVPDYKMTDEEKANNKGWGNAEGFYRDINFKDAFSDKWNNWSEANRKKFLALPNFDKKIFFEITGVKTK